jgi:uncharacterized protein (DUF58 family)
MNKINNIFLKDKRNLLSIKSKKKMFSNLIGEHNSTFGGIGLDFKDLREYSSGDDIRHINWKVTAKTMTPAINEYNEDKQLNIVVVYLNSGSIYFGTKKSKQETMIEALGSLGYSAVSKNDMLTTLFFSEDEEKFFQPSKHKGVIDLAIDTAIDLKMLGKEINYKKLNQYLLNKIKKRSIIFIVGDFLEYGDFRLLGIKHEVYCTIVRDRLEEDLKLFGEFNFVDTSSNDNENIFIDEASAKKYNQLLKQHDKQLFTHFKQSNIKYTKIYTDESVISKLSQLIKG